MRANTASTAKYAAADLRRICRRALNHGNRNGNSILVRDEKYFTLYSDLEFNL